ncbi:LeuD 3-isopropylmalate dehydratase small subunit [Candidatus Methylopumilus universalis]|uniref:3-isopropylmalate dehydratase small subunit n=1 Tax=Candidatus Methylopumilus universalis TaxID=2588536 RepID=UPI003BEED463
MKPFVTLTGILAPLDRANVDTDAIIPKQFLKSIKKTGFGPHLFDEWRYLDHGEPGMDLTQRVKNPDFVLNQDRYEKATILIARENFGCGSSREHAPWAIKDYGFGVILATSFADIFFSNCFKNGLLPIVLSGETIDRLFESTYANKGYAVTIDLENQSITLPSNEKISFQVDSFRKHCLINGLDDIGLTMQHSETIKAFEKTYYQKNSWLL